jgi:opacity protein-like surface antigen
MKRYIGFIIFCLCPLAVVAESSFGGAYIGVGVGLINSYFNGSRYVNTTRGGISVPSYADLTPYDNNVSVQGAIGYSFDYGRRYNFGFEANASLDNSNAKSNSSVNEFINTINIDINSGYELKSDVSLLFKPGFRFVENTLCYLLIGPRWGHFRVAQGVNYTFGTNKGTTSTQYVTQNKIGFSIGLGVLQKLTQHLALGAEYAFTDFGSLSEKVTYGTIYNGGTVSGSIVSITRKTSAKSNKVMLNLVYRFYKG